MELYSDSLTISLLFPNNQQGLEEKWAYLPLKVTLLNQIKDIIKHVQDLLDKEEKLTKKIPQCTAFSSLHNTLEFTPWKGKFKKLYVIALKCWLTTHNNFAFLHFFFLGMILLTASYTMSWTSVHNSSGALSDLIPWVYLSLPLYYCKEFNLGHTWI